MRVLHLIRKNTQLKASFIQNQIRNHIEFEPSVIFCEERGEQFDGGFADIKGLKVPTFNISSNNKLELLFFRYFKNLSWKQKDRLKDLMNEIKPDVIHLHYGTDAGIYLKTLKKFDIPKFVSFYGYECSGFPKRFFGLGRYYLKNWVFEYADKIFAMSEDMRRDLLSIGCLPEKIIVHYYGTDVEKFYAPHRYNNPTNIVRFLIISGLAPQKGHLFLLKAFAAAHKIKNNIRLTIVGSGELEELIIRYIKYLGIQNVVSMPGPVTYGSAKHLEYFNSHDVFVHPSVTDTNGDKEGIPGSIVEAMAAGLPVISTFHAGIPFVIENQKSGILVKEHDVNALANAILSLAESESLRRNMGQTGQHYALSYLDIKSKERDLERYYYESISAKKKH